MSYQIKIPLNMLFKKMNCCVCGKRLKLKKISQISHWGDPNFEPIKMRQYGSKVIALDDKQTVDRVVYYCPNCNVAFEYEDQIKIANIQKNKGKVILTEDELVQ